MAKVVIGVDPHKRINAVVVLRLARQGSWSGSVRERRAGFRELRAFSRQWRPRTWAIEGCNGVGEHVAQRLVAAGERVVDVSTRRAALVRVFAVGTAARTMTLMRIRSRWSVCTRRICRRCTPTIDVLRCGCCRTVVGSWSGNAPSV